MLRFSLTRKFAGVSFNTDFIKIKKANSQIKIDVDNSELFFGTDFTDHMAEVNYTDQNGWVTPSIKPFQMLQVHPANATIHYALSCFEGIFY
jgi:branched-chain amino acid aminotransferase